MFRLFCKNYDSNRVACCSSSIRKSEMGSSLIFFSFFQIDENRRIELNRDRMLAIEIERRLQLKCAQQIIPKESAMGNASTRNQIDCNASNYDTSAAIDSLIDDHSHTLRDDTITKTGQDIEDGVHVHSSSDESSSQSSDVHIKIKPSNIVSLTLAIDSSYGSTTPKMLSPNFSLHSSPSVNALDESRNLSLYFTPMSGRESLSPISFHKNQLHPSRLIRSNSYTLDKPSPMLLKHMEDNGINSKSPMATNRFRNNQNTTSTGIPRKSTEHSKDHKSRSDAVKTSIGVAKQPVAANASSTPNKNKVESSKNGSARSNSIRSSIASNKSASIRHQASVASIVFKNDESTLRSIYGQRLAPKVQHSNKKDKSSISIDSANKSTAQPSPMHVSNSITSNPSNNNNNITNSGNKLSTHDYNQIVGMFEQKQAELLKRQGEELKRMQEEFLRQQEELLQSVKTLIANKSTPQITLNGSSLNESSIMEVTKKSNEKMLIAEVNDELPVIVDSNGNRVNRFTPESGGKCIRRLLYDDNSNKNNNNNNCHYVDGNQLSPTKLSSDGSEQFEMYTVAEIRAANTIVAYAKGYLTRRLLKTKRVLDLQKMHHDTFELLMDISEEDNKNESKSDVEFKYNLLQQVICCFCCSCNSEYVECCQLEIVPFFLILTVFLNFPFRINSWHR